MTTSSNGYAVTEKKQTQGTYILGATSTESVKVKNSKGKEVTKESRLTVYGSNMLIDDQTNWNYKDYKDTEWSRMSNRIIADFQTFWRDRNIIGII